MSFKQGSHRIHPQPAHPLQDLGSIQDLGGRSCSWENEKFFFGERRSFTRFTKLEELVDKLKANPHVILLNLDDHQVGDKLMNKMAEPITALRELQVLILSSAWPSSFFIVCI